MTDMTLEQAQLACKYGICTASAQPVKMLIWIYYLPIHCSKSEIEWGRRCYGFQFLPTSAYNLAVAQENSVPSVGSPFANFKGVTLPNVFFYSPTVDVKKTSSYGYAHLVIYLCISDSALHVTHWRSRFNSANAVSYVRISADSLCLGDKIPSVRISMIIHLLKIHVV
jgi:hypothetical protein